MPDIYISLGSNIDPEANLPGAIKALRSRLHNNRISPVYRSPPVAMQGADFYNAVISGSTHEPVSKVIDWLLATEIAFGRVKTANKFTSRTLDLDLLLYGNTIFDSVDGGHTRLPHPDIIDQAYVLQPLADIASELIHPQCKSTIGSLLSQLQSQSPEKIAALTPVTLALTES